MEPNRTLSLSSEVLSSKDIEDIISYNKSIVKKYGQRFEVDKNILDRILNRMISYNNIQNRRQRIIKKATHILVAITYYQPFFEGNRRTALFTTISFLQRNGFNLPLDIVDGVYDLLNSLKEQEIKITNDPIYYNHVLTK